MRITGKLFQPREEYSEGFKVKVTGTGKKKTELKYAHLSFSVGVKKLVRDAEGKVVMEAGKAKEAWENTYYRTTFFRGLAEKAQEVLAQAAAKGQKFAMLELSGENEQSVWNKNGKSGINNDFRVIAFRVQGEDLWWTTKEGVLVQKEMN